MKAYSQGITKEQFVNEMKWHQKQDNFLKGTYSESDGDEFKGCAVGCGLRSIMKIKNWNTIEYNNHALLAKYLDIPEWLVRVQDKIFEKVSLDRSKTWPVDFSQAINEGSNLDLIKIPFLKFIVESSLRTVSNLKYNAEEYPKLDVKVKASILYNKEVMSALDSGDFEKAKEARNKYNDVAYATYSSAAYSLDAAAYFLDAAAAAYAAAADAAAYAATYAAYASAYAASDYAASDYAAAAAYAADYAADYVAYADSYRQTKMEYFADKLLELMKGCV